MKDKKSQIIIRTNIVTMIIGIGLVAVGLFTKFDYYSTLILAMGCGLTFSAMVHLFRVVYWQNPKHHSEYKTKMREAYINKVDERKQYLEKKL